MMTTRSEHVQWAKQRALEELDADPDDSGSLLALTSLISDLSKHPETQDHLGIRLTMGLVLSGRLNSAEDVRERIEGFQ